MPAGESSDIEVRLAAVEAEVRLLREQQATTATDAVAARVLAAGADRDVSEVRAELRAHTRALNALRETQMYQDQRLAGIDGRLDRLETKVDTGFAALNDTVGRILVLVERMAGES